MKQLIILSLACFISLSALAQTEADSKFINGAFSINVFGGNGGTNLGVQIAPGFGYFIKDMLAAGGSLGIFSSSFGGNSSTSVILSPFIRHYWPIVEHSFYFTMNGALSFIYGQSASVGNITLTNNNEVFSISLDASPGFVYFPAPHWSLDFGFSGIGFILVGSKDPAFVLKSFKFQRIATGIK